RRAKSVFHYCSFRLATLMVSPLTSPSTVTFRLSVFLVAFSAAAALALPAASSARNLLSAVKTPYPVFWQAGSSAHLVSCVVANDCPCLTAEAEHILSISMPCTSAAEATQVKLASRPVKTRIRFKTFIVRYSLQSVLSYRPPEHQHGSAAGAISVQ